MATNPPPSKKPKSELLKCVKDFQRILECPICLQTPTNPDQTYFCSNGHLICGDCVFRIKKCPVCQTGKLIGQNPLLKQIIAAMPKLCPFEGCDDEPKGNKLEEHKKICQFRPLDCLTHSRYNCKDKIPFNSYLQHLENKKEKPGRHNFYVITVRETTFTHDLIDYRPSIFSFYGKTFIIKCIKSGNLFHCQCFIHGSEEEAQQFFCEIEVKGKNPKYNIKMSGDVISLDVKRENYEKGEYFDSLTFSTAMAHKIRNKDKNTIVMEATIKKV